MVGTRPKISLLAMLATLLSLCGVQAAHATQEASVSELPPHLELEALTVGASGEAFVSTFQPLESGIGTPQGTYVFELSPTGAVKEFRGVVHGSLDGLAGIVAGPADSLWLPTSKGVLEVAEEGVKRTVSLGRPQVHDLATDHKGGVWVLNGSRVFHVDPRGRSRQLRLRLVGLGRSCCAIPARSVVDPRGDLWIAVARDGNTRTKELVEHTPNGHLRSFRIHTRFPYAGEIGILQGMPILQSGHRFLRLDIRTGRFESLNLPEQPCFLTESDGVWCQTPKSLYRAFPHGEASATPLPRPGTRVGQVVSGPRGEVWYGAEVATNCESGPNTCTSPSISVLVGRVQQ